MFRILSGILTIGNLEFSTDDEGFTRQNFDEDKSKNNLSIIAVAIHRFILFNCSSIFFFLEYVWSECRIDYGMFNNDHHVDSSRTSDKKIQFTIESR